MRKQVAFGLASGLILAVVFAVGPVASVAQTATPTPPTASPNPPDSEKGDKAESYRQFDHFLRTNPDAAEQIKKNPQLLNDPSFLSKHPGLQKYMSTHPDMAEQAKSDPGKLMEQTHRAAKRHADYHKDHQRQAQPMQR